MLECGQRRGGASSSRATTAPTLVLLDVRLPGIDGFEVLRRSRPAASRIPVII